MEEYIISLSVLAGVFIAGFMLRYISSMIKMVIKIVCLIVGVVAFGWIIMFGLSALDGFVEHKCSEMEVRGSRCYVMVNLCVEDEPPLVPSKYKSRASGIHTDSNNGDDSGDDNLRLEDYVRIYYYDYSHSKNGSATTGASSPGGASSPSICWSTEKHMSLNSYWSSRVHEMWKARDRELDSLGMGAGLFKASSAIYKDPEIEYNEQRDRITWICSKEAISYMVCSKIEPAKGFLNAFGAVVLQTARRIFEVVPLAFHLVVNGK